MNITDAITNCFNCNKSKDFSKKRILLPKKVNHDTFTFTSSIKGENMSLYSRLNGTQYILKTQNEITFENAVKTISELGKNGVETKSMALDTFCQAYENLSMQIQDDKEDNTDTLIYLFCSLLECLDCSKSKQISTYINYYLFEDFISKFGNREDLKDIIEKIISSDILNKKVLKIRLQNLIRQE